ncbi:MAG: hypothetical protein IPI81_06670 [Flavobacteriales bacterium]|nr:hypothetical protein [Flavobacteriales bacterium]MCC6937159.1 hypothetical protein [Flavobacteriales bacterium]
MNQSRIGFASAILLLLGSCSTEPVPQADENDPCGNAARPQYNITVFLDLSDRIDTSWSYTPQWQLDTAVVMSIVERFREDTKVRKTYCAEGMIRFRADPPNPALNPCISSTEVDFSPLKTADRAGLWKGMSAQWRSCLEGTYLAALEEGKRTHWPGSNVWGFMRDVDSFMKPGYRNILIVLTDGEPYYEGNAKVEQGMEWANITSTRLKPYAKGSEEASLDALRKAGVKIMNPRATKTELDGLEVLVLGVRPSDPKNAHIFPMLQYLWSDLFQQMGIDSSRIFIQKAGTTADAKDAVKRFFSH